MALTPVLLDDDQIRRVDSEDEPLSVVSSTPLAAADADVNEDEPLGVVSSKPFKARKAQTVDDDAPLGVVSSKPWKSQLAGTFNDETNQPRSSTYGEDISLPRETLTYKKAVLQSPAGADRQAKKDEGEITRLSADDEAKFQKWAKANKITDVDQPQSRYDYRGFWQEKGDVPVQFGVDHFPDTYKQHGHPTFSVESKYSSGLGDGGTWKGETFVPSSAPRQMGTRQPGEARIQAVAPPKAREGVLGWTIDAAAGLKDYASKLITTTQVGTSRVPTLSPEGEQLIPFMGSIAQAGRAAEVLDAARRVLDDKGSLSDERIVQEFLAQGSDAPQSGGRAFGYNVAKTAAMIVPFAIEFMATGGTYTATKEAAEAGITKLLGEAAEKIVAKRAGRAATTLATGAAGALAQTATNVPRLAEGTLRRQAEAALTDKDDGFLPAFAQAFPDTFVEIASERSGHLLEGPMAKLAELSVAKRAAAIKAAVMGRWLKIHPGSTVSDFLDRVRSETAWNGVLGEMFEERVGEAMHYAMPGPLHDQEQPGAPAMVRAVTGEQADPNRPVADPRQQAIKDLGAQLALEAVSFAAPGAVRLALESVAGQKATPAPSTPPPPVDRWQAQDDQRTEAQRQATVAAMRPRRMVDPTETAPPTAQAPEAPGEPPAPPTGPTEPPASSTPPTEPATDVPTAITPMMRANLRAAGLADTEIDAMTPEQAWETIRSRPPAEPAPPVVEPAPAAPDKSPDDLSDLTDEEITAQLIANASARGEAEREALNAKAKEEYDAHEQAMIDKALEDEALSAAEVKQIVPFADQPPVVKREIRRALAELVEFNYDAMDRPPEDPRLGASTYWDNHMAPARLPNASIYRAINRTTSRPNRVLQAAIRRYMDGQKKPTTVTRDIIAAVRDRMSGAIQTDPNWSLGEEAGHVEGEDFYPEQRRIGKPDEAKELETIKHVAANGHAILDAYEEKHGTVLNADDMSEQLGVDEGDQKWKWMHAVRSSAAELVQSAYENWILRPRDGFFDAVIMLGGGTGSGKSSTYWERGPFGHIVLDTTMGNKDATQKNIDKALRAGRPVQILFTYRDPIEAYEDGVVPRRAEKGRDVGPQTHADTHYNAPRVLLELAEHYKGNKDVSITVIENRAGHEMEERSLDWLQTQTERYNDLDALRTAVQDAADRHAARPADSTVGDRPAAGTETPTGRDGKVQPQSRGERPQEAPDEVDEPEDEMASQGSIYAGDKLADLVDAAADEQRLRWADIQTLEQALKDPKGFKGDKQRFEAQKRLQDVRSTYESAYGELEDAGADVDAVRATVEAPTTDTLSTGEQQPRLPGEVGKVRDTEVAGAPVADLPEQGFDLTDKPLPEAEQKNLIDLGGKPQKAKPKVDTGMGDLFVTQDDGPAPPVAFTAKNLAETFDLQPDQAEAAVAIAEAMDLPLEQIALVNGGTPGDRAMFQSEPTNAPRMSKWYYSNIASALTIWQNKGTADQLLAHLKKFKGAMEEAETIGFDAWLKEHGSVTRESARQWLEGHQINVQEVTRDESLRAHDKGRSAKFANYQLPGGENYREVLLTVPAKVVKTEQQAPIHGNVKFSAIERVDPEFARALDDEWFAYADRRLTPEERDNELNNILYRGDDGSQIVSGEMATRVINAFRNEYHQVQTRKAAAARHNAETFRSGHWDEPNVVAHLRLNDRTIDGKRTLFIEEAQSDWGQKGKKYGFASEVAARSEALKVEEEQIRTDLRTAHGQDRVSLTEKLAEVSKQLLRIRMTQPNVVPNMPFKGNAWPKLAMKRVLAMAAEEGYDAIAFTTGTQQADRYDLSKQISRVEIAKTSTGAYLPEAGPFERGMLRAYDMSGKRVIDKHISRPEELADYIGKDAAEKILQQPEKANPGHGGEYARVRTLGGLDLKVGGEGMSGFYDRTLPAIANDLVKKYGVKVGTVELVNDGGERRYDGPDHTLSEVQRVAEDQQLSSSTRSGLRAVADLMRDGMTFAEAVAVQPEAVSFALGGSVVRGSRAPVHFLELSQDMREDIREHGMPLFQGHKAAVEFTEGGKALIRAMDKPDVSSVIHELAHVARRFLLDRNVETENRAGISDADIETAETWAGAKNGQWNEAAEEKFARGFERYLRDGIAPTSKLTALFAKMADWLGQIYRTLKGSSIDITISPEMRKVYDNLVTRRHRAENGQLTVTPQPLAAATPTAENIGGFFPGDRVVVQSSALPKGAGNVVTLERSEGPSKAVVIASNGSRHTVGIEDMAGVLASQTSEQRAANLDRARARVNEKQEPTTETPSKREFASTQINLPGSVADNVRAAAALIQDKDLAADGREDTPHVTVQFGVHDQESKPVADALTDHGPIKLTLGTFKVFPNGESNSGDVVYASLADESREALLPLRESIRSSGEVTDTHPTFTPHVTVAYVKPGRGKFYAWVLNKKASLAGQTFDAPAVTFSPAEGEKTTIQLGAQTPVNPKQAAIDTERAANKAERTKLLAELKAKLSGRANMGVDPDAVLLMVKIVRTYIKDGILDFREAALAFQEDFGAGARALDAYLEDAWKILRKEDVSVADALKGRKVEEEGTDGPEGVGPELTPGIDDQAAGGPGTSSDGGVVGGEPATPQDGTNAERPTDGRGGRAGGRVRSPSGTTAAASGGDASGRGGRNDTSGNVDAAPANAPKPVKSADARGAKPKHFVITNVDVLTAGGAVAKLNDNISAIELLKTLEQENRPASAAEQLVLSRYVGWGNSALSPVFEPRGIDFISDPKMKEARQRLEGVLSRQEISDIADSVLNAHYSFAEIPRGMWSAVQRLGFKGGSILEPAVGTGHFLGMMPGPIVAHPRTRIFGVDLEPIAAGIARQLYQDAYIQTSPLEDAQIPMDYFDLVISNVPFSDVGVFDAAFASSSRKFMTEQIHNYYFGKALDAVRPGGLIAFVTSNGTMDSQADTHRRYIASRAKFIGAIRLPREAFKGTAGTEVVTDIIFLQRRMADDVVTDVDAAVKRDPWLKSVQRSELGTSVDTKTGSRYPIRTNEYYARHPEMIIGKESNAGTMYRKNSYTVEGFNKQLDVAAFTGAIERLPKNLFKPTAAPVRTLASVDQAASKQGTYVMQDGVLHVHDQGTLTPAGYTGDALKRAVTFLPIRDAFQSVLEALNTRADDATLAAAQKKLTRTYEAFVRQWGPVNKPANANIIQGDPNGPRVLALENVVKDGQKIVVKSLADIFTKRVVNPPTEPTTAASPTDALGHSLAWKGYVDLDYMGSLLGKPPAEVAQDLAGQIYQDPLTAAWYPKAIYLSGDVVTKLAQAKARATVDPAFQANADALEAVQPTLYTPDDFTIPFGATYTPIPSYQAFLKDVTKQTLDISLLNTQTKVEFYVEPAFGSHEFLPSGANLADWVADTLNGRLPTLRSGDPPAPDAARTEAYHQSMQQLREQWAQWWIADPDQSEVLTKIYNAMFNREVKPQYDEIPVVLPNSSPLVVFRPWQNRGVVRTMQTGNTLINHAVGSGKTLVGVAIAAEWKRRGLASKIMIPVPNQVTDSWRSQFLSLYPTARLLVTTKEDFQKANRKKLLARVATNDWDAIIVGHTQFLSIPVKTEYLKAFIQSQEDLLLLDGANQMNMSVDTFKELVDKSEAGDEVATRALGGRNAPRSVKDIVRSIKRLRIRLKARLAKDKAGESPVTFEEMGIDALIVDEAHDFKNLFFSTSKNNIKGLQGSDSDRAMDMFLKVRQINQASNSRNLVFLTGTPLTNTMSEVYTLFRYLAQDELDRLGMAGADSFFNNYAVAVSESEPAPGGGYKEVTRLRYWNNLKQLSLIASKFTDTVTTADMVASGHIKLPAMKNGKATILSTKPHAMSEYFMETLQARLARIKEGKPMVLRPGGRKDGGDVVDNYLVVSNDAKKFALDPRLVGPEYDYDPNGRIPTVAKKIAAVYRDSTPVKGTQIVFLDMGVPKGKDIPALPDHVLQDVDTDIADEVVEPDVDTDISEDAAEAQRVEDELNDVSRDLYSDLRSALVKSGVPNNEIAYIHQARNPLQLKLLFKAVNDGRIRVLITSRSKGGVGVNVQKRGVHVVHVDVPWRPDQVEQADGRFFRQGNDNPEVEKTIMVTEKSFDEFQWGLLAKKNQSFSGFWKGEVTSLEDINTAQIDFEIASALSSGDPRSLQLMNVAKDVRGLRARATNFESRQKRSQRDLAYQEGMLSTQGRFLDTFNEVLPQARAWAEQPTIAILMETGSRYYRSLSARDRPLMLDVSDKDGRASLQGQLEQLLQQGSVYTETEIATAGPYVIIAQPVNMPVDDPDGETHDVKGVQLTVKVGPFILGSTPEWTGRESEKAPDYYASLRTYMSVPRLEREQGRSDRLVKETQDQLVSLKETLSKTFSQGPELRAKEQELEALNVALKVYSLPALDVTKIKTKSQLVHTLEMLDAYRAVDAITVDDANSRLAKVIEHADKVNLPVPDKYRGGTTGDTPSGPKVLYQESEREPDPDPPLATMDEIRAMAALTRTSVNYQIKLAEDAGFLIVDEGKPPAGNINLNKFPIPQEMKRDLERIIEENDAYMDQRRGVRSWATTRAVAEAIPMPKRVPDAGRALNAEQLEALAGHIITTRERLDGISDQIADAADRRKGVEPTVLLEQSRLLAQEQVLLATYAGGVAEAGRALNILRKIRQAIQSDDHRLIEWAVKQMGGRDTIEDIARRLRAFPKDDAIGKYRFIHGLTKAGYTDWLSWWWYTSLLSGPVTHVRNLFGNTSNLAYQFLSMPSAAAMDAAKAIATGTPRSVYLGESAMAFAGLKKGVDEGWKKAVFLMQNGFTLDDVDALEFRPPEVAGGLKTNFIGRALEASDMMFRSMAAMTELYRLAYAAAKAKGFTPGSDEGAAFVERYLAEPPIAAIEAIQKEGLRSVFRSEPSKFLKAIMTLRNDFRLTLPSGRKIKIWNPVKFVIPFVQTPAKIMAAGLEASPLGFVSARFKETARERSQADGRALLGTALLMPLAYIVAQGLVSGSGPDDKELKDNLYRMGWLPNSIKIGDTWYNYSNFQPLSLPLSIMANAYEAWTYSGKVPDAGTIALKTVNSLMDQSFLSGLSSLLDAMETPERWKQIIGNRTLNSLLGLASLRSQIARAIDATVRQPDSTWEYIKANTPFASQSVLPMRDAFGEESKRGGSTTSRAVSPVTMSDTKDGPVDRALLEMRGVYQLGFPSKMVTVAKGEQVKLTPEEYDALIKDGGHRIKARVSELVENSGWMALDDEVKADNIKQIVDTERAQARARIVPRVKKRLNRP